MQPGYQQGSETQWWWRVAKGLDEAQLALSNAMTHNVDDPSAGQALYERLREGQAILLEIFRRKGLVPAVAPNGSAVSGPGAGMPMGGGPMSGGPGIPWPGMSGPPPGVPWPGQPGPSAPSMEPAPLAHDGPAVPVTDPVTVTAEAVPVSEPAPVVTEPPTVEAPVDSGVGG